MTYVIRQLKSPTKSHSRVICMLSTCHLHVIHMSSAHHLHIICHEISTPKYFQSKSRTALLKIKCCINKSLKIPSSRSSGRVKGEARNMKSMWLPLAAIFFITNFYRPGGPWPLSPPGSTTDPLSSTCLISSESRVLDLESEINQSPGFNPHWG